MNHVSIPVGRSGFADIRKNQYYYIDKSGLIEELVRTAGTQVTLITRPRRFGKTLGMSMLSEFFDIQKDSRLLFDGLYISRNKLLCDEWMNQYPTLFLTFKSVDGLDFEKAYSKLVAVVAQAYQEQLYLLDSEKVNAYEKSAFDRIASKTGTREEVENALLILTRMMAAHYEKPVILLLDEYDVPLAKASEKGYYTEMMDVMKGLMQVIKDNNSLKMAVITGCLRIAKESIFTGTNNFVSDTISDTRLNEYFGFTESEVNKLLQDTELTKYMTEIREWYDGYHFGDFDIYCPWDVMNHVNNLIVQPGIKPKSYWENTSDNAIIRSFLDRTQFDVNEKFETLLAGGCIVETIEEKLTYDVIDSSESNLWTLLYFTGYLTTEPKKEGIPFGKAALKIPNLEIREIFRKSVNGWFSDKSSSSDRSELFAALWAGNTEKLSVLISELLFDTISYHDYKESFYHAFIVGLVSNAGYQVESNYEMGLGRSDIVIKDRRNRRASVIEIKWTETEAELEKACDDALKQIEDKQYARKVERSGYKNVIRFGIAFWQKKCLVKKNVL